MPLRFPGFAAETGPRVAVADTLVDGYEPASGVYEQFAGFHTLEPLLIAEVAPRRPIAADLLLGWERTRRAQVLKQADVLMLHHLVPDEVERGSLLPNLEYYEPRTAHGSSLSPAIHAGAPRACAQLQRGPRGAVHRGEDRSRRPHRHDCGRSAPRDDGRRLAGARFRLPGRPPERRPLIVDPRLPPQWHSLQLALRFRGEPFRLSIDRLGAEIESDGLAIRRANGIWEVCEK